MDKTSRNVAKMETEKETVKAEKEKTKNLNARGGKKSIKDPRTEHFDTAGM